MAILVVFKNATATKHFHDAKIDWSDDDFIIINDYCNNKKYSFAKDSVLSIEEDQ